MRRLALASIAAVLTNAGLGGVANAVTGAARPQVGALNASQLTLPAVGGSTRVTARIWNATTCLWSGEWQGTTVSTNQRPVGCTPSGGPELTISDTLTLPANGSNSARVWILYLIAKGPGGTSRWGHLSITQQGLSTTPTTTVTTPTPTAPANTSPNWSGYVLPSASLFTEVGGSWTVPTLNCSTTPNAGASAWVGIGGDSWPTGGSSGVLLQTGVTMACTNGSQQTYSWFEEVPSTPNESQGFVGFAVSPGDSIQATVYQGTNGLWETRLDDLTTGLSGVMVTGEGWGVTADSGSGTFLKQGSTAGLSYSGGYTAEWIIEAYDQVSAAAGSQVQLADYGTVAFTNLTTSLSTWSLTPAESFAIFQNGALVSQPSAPTNGSFSIQYTG